MSVQNQETGPELPVQPGPEHVAAAYKFEELAVQIEAAPAVSRDKLGVQIVREERDMMDINRQLDPPDMGVRTFTTGVGYIIEQLSGRS
jgi:hypothetical protein